MNTLELLGALVAQSTGITGNDELDGLMHDARAEMDKDMDAKQYEAWKRVGEPLFNVKLFGEPEVTK